ncbi:AraC family transcriptional regulator [Streptomyces spiroverticillatus]|nr:AraC family transcriptional regulator [Streptomyces finlayi]
MDALTDLLRTVHTDGAILRRSVTAPPWSVAHDSAAPLTLYAVLRGRAWVVVPGEEPVLLAPGDTAVVRGPGPHHIADAPDTPPRVRVHDALHCTLTHDGSELPESATPRLGPRTYGPDPDAPVALVTGAHRVAGSVGRRLLDALPPLLTVPAGDSSATLLTLLTEELDRELPGQQTVLDRLLDLLLVRTLRAWFARPQARPPAWYAALGDPVAGAALKAMHGDPAHPWTVASLAARAGVSRAGLARRFTALVGEPPLSYLTHWRMTLATDLLREPGATVASVARQVGYTNAFAFSTAYKRTLGISPSRTATTPGPA